MSDQLTTERHHLVVEALPMVHRMAAAVCQRAPWTDRDDLVGAGTIGLIEAAVRFDETVGVTFCSYASSRVRGAMYDAIRKDDPAGRDTRRAIQDVAAAEDHLLAKHKRSPTLDEISDEAGMTTDRVSELRAARTTWTSERASLDLHIESRAHPQSLVQHDDHTERITNQDLVDHALKVIELLPTSFREVARRVVITGQTTGVALAAELGVDESRVSQMRTIVIDVLREVYADLNAMPLERPDKGTTLRRNLREALRQPSFGMHVQDAAATAEMPPVPQTVAGVRAELVDAVAAAPASTLQADGDTNPLADLIDVAELRRLIDLDVGTYAAAS